MKTIVAQVRAEFLRLSRGDRVAMIIVVVVLPILAIIFALLGMYPIAIITGVIVFPLASAIIDLSDVIRQQASAEPPTEE